MRSSDQVAYLERMLTMVRTNTRDDGPGVSHTPVEEYYDPARYQREVSLLFRRHPIMVAFSGQLRKAGDFVVHNDTGQPILVVRGTDGTLRIWDAGPWEESAGPNDTNSITEPAKIVPVTQPLKNVASSFRYTFPAWSITVLEIEVR